ncbi:MAG: hypothetical protein ACREKR_02205 [Candidatus Methylomirabilales bacterium]
MRYVVSKKLCWFMIVVLLFTFSGLPDLAFAQTPSQSAEMKQVADRLKKMFKALEQAEREIPRDTFDAKAIVAKVGKDPVKLFEWVRDNTYLVPYRGVLRGPQGVLMDRLGNSLDRAILLHALLRSAGHEVRLAHSTLPEEHAAQVLQKARPIPKGGLSLPPPSRQAIDQLAASYARQYELDAGELREIMDKVDQEQHRLAEETVQRVADQTLRIVAAVGKGAGDTKKAEKAAAVEAVRDHWWVQLQQGSTWRDLDPSLRDAEPGRALAVATETPAPEKYSDLKEDLLHTVQIQVVVEVWKQGKVTEAPVLKQTLIPAAVIGQRIALRHVPVAWPEDMNLFAEKDPVKRLKTTVLAQKEWVPILSVGSGNVSRYSFNDRGDRGDTTLPGYIQNVLAGRELVYKMEEGAASLGKQIEGMFGQPKTEEPKRQPPEGAKGQQLTAEWIDYEIRVPGQPVRKIRRQIFDFLGPAARLAGKVAAPEITEAKRLERGLILLGETEILPLVSQLSPQFVEHLVASNMLANRKVLSGLVGQGVSITSEDFIEQLRSVTPLPSQLYGLALARRDWSRFRGDVYLASPNMLSYHVRFRQDEQGNLLLRYGFDIIANEVAVRPEAATDPFLIRLELGVLDTNAEALLTKGGGSVENTAEIFAQSAAQGIEWLTLRDARDPSWSKVQLPKDVRARIDQDLAAGYTVLVPKEAVPMEGGPLVGWWRVNPRTGHTLGIGESGWGQTATEYFVKLLKNPGTYLFLLTMYCKTPGGQKWTICGGCWLFYMGLPFLFFGLAGAIVAESGMLGFLFAAGVGAFSATTRLGRCVDTLIPPKYQKHWTPPTVR